MDPESFFAVFPSVERWQERRQYFVPRPSRDASNPEMTACWKCGPGTKTAPAHFCEEPLHCYECDGAQLCGERSRFRGSWVLFRCVNGDHVICGGCAGVVDGHGGARSRDDDDFLDNTSVLNAEKFPVVEWHDQECVTRGHHQYRRVVTGTRTCSFCSQPLTAAQVEGEQVRCLFCERCNSCLCGPCSKQSSEMMPVCSQFQNRNCKKSPFSAGGLQACLPCREAKKVYAPALVDEHGRLCGRMSTTKVHTYADAIKEIDRGKEGNGVPVPIPFLTTYLAPSVIDMFLTCNFSATLDQDASNEIRQFESQTKTVITFIENGPSSLPPTDQAHPFTAGWKKWCNKVLSMMFSHSFTKQQVSILVNLEGLVGNGSRLVRLGDCTSRVPVLIAETLATSMQGRYEAAMGRERERLAQCESRLSLAKQARQAIDQLLRAHRESSLSGNAEYALHVQLSSKVSSLRTEVDGSIGQPLHFAAASAPGSLDAQLFAEKQLQNAMLRDANSALENIKQSFAQAQKTSSKLDASPQRRPGVSEWSLVDSLHPDCKEARRNDLTELDSLVQEVASIAMSSRERQQRVGRACTVYAQACQAATAEAEKDWQALEKIEGRLKQRDSELCAQVNALKNLQTPTEQVLRVLEVVDKRLEGCISAYARYINDHLSSLIARHEVGWATLQRDFLSPTLAQATQFRFKLQSPFLPDMQQDEVCQALMAFKVHSVSVETMYRSGLGGEAIASVMRAAGSSGRRVEDLDEVLELKAGLHDLLERKFVVHVLDVMYLGLDAHSYTPGDHILGAEWWSWTESQVQAVLASNGLDGFVPRLEGVNGCTLRLLTKRKDLAALGITALSEQQQMLEFVKTLPPLPPDCEAPALLGEQVARAGHEPVRALQLAGDRARGEPLPATVSGIRLVRFDEIRDACNDFGRGAVIGQGGFGTVFAGNIGSLQARGREPRTFAVKRLAAGSEQGEAEFLREVQVLVMCKHPNLVPLVRVAIEGSERCLIYPLMKRGNLQERLASDIAFPCAVRARVAADVLRGIVYLHSASGDKATILHRDLKAQNILLDEHDTARISDVGMARLLCDPQDENRHVSTRNLVGTFGYICPVFSSQGKFFESSDGFAVGVVLLQLLTGLPAVDPDVSARPRDLATRMRRAKPLGATAQADARAGKWNHNVALGLATVAVSLIQSDEEDRMPLSEALSQCEALLEHARREAGQDQAAQREARECIICMLDERAARFVPCSHMLTCKPCAAVVASQLKCCPLCSQAIRGVADALPNEDTFVVPRVD